MTWTVALTVAMTRTATITAATAAKRVFYLALANALVPL